MTVIKAIFCKLRPSKHVQQTFRCFASISPSPQEQQIQVNNQTINYIKVGNNSQNTILCFPGALGTIWSDFKPQIEGLDKSKFTIIGWDPPGYGFSRPPNKKFTTKFYEDDAQMAFDFMKSLGVNKFSLLGWSDGGISAMILAAKHPNVIHKLVVWGSNAYVLPEEIKIYEGIRNIDKWSPKMKGPLIDLYTAEGLQSMWNGWCDVLVEIQKQGGDICKNLLKDINCPTLILHGDKDPMIAPEHPHYLLSNIKDSRIYRFPDGKHNIHLRYPEEFNRIVTNFLLE